MDDESKYAREVWEAVVDGSSSMIEWFDTGARGDTNEAIASCIGLSQTRISTLVRSVVNKLRLRTRTQLVYWVRGLGLPVSRRSPPQGQPRLRKSA